MWWIVIVAALGYFVDIYDLLLFSIVRVQSLQGLGLTGSQLMDKGVLLINCQMAGLLIGGVFWGIWGDRKGRLKVLFGSIFLYSVANLANAFVNSVEAFAVCRFIAGLGLAGELGAGVTLVCESLPQKYRGYGTAMIASIGISGAVVAGIVAELLPWRHCFAVGGVLGLLLLALRLRVTESSLFLKQTKIHANHGNFLALITKKSLLKKYVRIICVGLPLWFVVGILITFAPEFAAELGLSAVPKAGMAVSLCYAGATIGDLVAGVFSQLIKKRKLVIVLFILSLCVIVPLHLFNPWKSLEAFYTTCFILGFFSGYWAMFVTVAAESFGTNLRATVAVTAPNFVRGALIPMSLSFRLLSTELGLRNSALLVGFAVMALAIYSAWGLAETYSRDLDFEESLV